MLSFHQEKQGDLSIMKTVGGHENYFNIPYDKYTIFYASLNNQIVSYAIIIHSNSLECYFYNESEFRDLKHVHTITRFDTNKLHRNKDYGSQLLTYIKENINEILFLRSIIETSIIFYLKNGGIVIPSPYVDRTEKLMGFNIPYNIPYNILSQYLSNDIAKISIELTDFIKNHDYDKMGEILKFELTYNWLNTTDYKTLNNVDIKTLIHAAVNII